MPNIFETILQALNLDKINIGNNTEEWKRQNIYNGQKEILRSYGTCPAAPLDFSSSSLRDAYCVLYLASHIHLARSILKAVKNVEFSRWLHQLSERRSCKVVSIGGGPGSDLLGLAMFLSKDAGLTNVHIDCNVYDLYTDWGKSLNQIGGHLEHLINNKCSVNYHKYNFIGEMDWSMHDNLLGADIVIFMKSVSSFPQIPEYAAKLQALLQHVKPGTVVLFIDNLGGPHFKIMENLASGVGFISMFKTYRRVDIPTTEKKSIHRFKLLPGSKKVKPIFSQCSLEVAAYVWQKDQFGSRIKRNCQEHISSFKSSRFSLPFRNHSKIMICSSSWKSTRTLYVSFIILSLAALLTLVIYFYQ